MNRLIARSAALTTAVLTTVLLAGCAGGDAAPAVPTVTVTATATVTPQPSPTGSATPDANGAKSVVLGSDAFTVSASEGTISASYTGGVTPAVDALSTVLGRVEPTFLPAGKCNGDQTTYDWGGLQLTYQGTDAATSESFTLFAGSAPTTYEVSTPVGAKVGGDFKSYVAKVSSSMPERTTAGTPRYDSVLESVLPGGASSTLGTVVSATDGVITSIGVPQDFDGDC